MSRAYAGLAAILLVTSCRTEAPTSGDVFFARRVSDARTELDEVQFRSFRKDGRLASILTLGEPGGITESRLSLVPPFRRD